MLTQTPREGLPARQARPTRVSVVRDARGEGGRAESLAALLEPRGFKVESVPLGRGMRRALVRTRPHAVILDVAECGREFRRLERCLQASRLLHRVPVLVVAERSTPRERARALADGAADFITRPCDGRELSARIRASRRAAVRRDRAERECMALRELEGKREELLQMVAHDMGSPLFVVHCSLEMLLSADVLPEEKRVRMLTSILQAARSLGGMLSDLRDVRRFTAGEMTLKADEHDLGDLARRAMENVGVNQGEPRVVLDVPGIPMPVLCDGPMIQRVMENLLTRAIKASPRDGRVIVRILPLSTGPIVRVSDPGPALPRELHDRMFERFGQVDLHREGKKCSSALALAFCKMAVDAHRGRIGVESEEGRGNTLWFTIPA